MKHNLEFKNCAPDRHLRQFVNDSIARLDEVVNSRSSAVFLRMFVEKNAARTLYRVSLTLNVPRRTLAAQEERHDLLEAVREAFMELERELRKHKEQLTHSDTYKRPARRQELRRQKTEAVAKTHQRRELFFGLIEPHLEALYNFIRREISYRIAVKDLLPGEITADDAVAAIVLRGSREFERDFEKRDIRGWLIHLALARSGGKSCTG